MPAKFVQVLPVLLSERLVLEEAFGELFKDSVWSFPVRWAEVRSKGLPTLEVEYVVYDVREEPHDIWVVFELPEASLNIVSGEDDICGRVCDAQVPDSR